MAQLVGTWLTISDDGGDDGDTITATVTALNTGRNSRSVVVEGHLVSDNTVTATATFTQDGHEFVEFEENLEPYEPNNIDYFHEDWAFFCESNSKYLAISFSDGSHFGLNDNRLLVDPDYNGIYDIYTPDANGAIEITNDPGLENKYRVLVGLDFPQNNTGSDITDTLTVRGWSASGAQGVSFTINLVHKANTV